MGTKREIIPFSPLPGKEWRAIEEWMGYEVSNFGRVRRVSLMVARPNSDGYPMVHLSFGKRGKARLRAVHILVTQAFHGPRPSPRHTASHEDGVRSNCRSDNLLWETHSENLARRRDHGTHIVGERNGTAKLTTNQVLEIRAKRAAGPRGIVKALALEYGMSESTISRICLRQGWSHV